MLAPGMQSLWASRITKGFSSALRRMCSGSGTRQLNGEIWLDISAAKSDAGTRNRLHGAVFLAHIKLKA